MKIYLYLFRIILIAFGIGVFLIFISGCNKDSTVPVLTTSAVSAITSSSAASGGNITSDGGATITARGVCWSTGQTPSLSDSKTSDGTGTGAFISTLTVLIPDTAYYVRAYATNSAGTGYGSILSFATSAIEPGTVTDIDGNVYHTVTIHDQVWLAENLKTTHYRTGDPINPGIAKTQNSILSEEGTYYDYNNDPANSAIYGRLYDWYAVVNPFGLAPEGFRVATFEDWTTLVDYLGGAEVAGGKLKEEGNAHWGNDNVATNESGFTALPAGTWDCTSSNFTFLGQFNMIWTSTEIHSYDAYAFTLVANVPGIYHGGAPKHMGYSVRCLKN